MSRSNNDGDTRGSNDEYFNETASPNSSFVEDSWVNPDTKEEQSDNYDNIDEVQILTKTENNKNKQVSPHVKTKEELTLELGTAGICGLLFVRNFVEGGMIGMAFGGITGIMHGFQTGSHKAPGFGRAVLGEATRNVAGNLPS